ncbi:oxidoreductase [Xylariales sp. AK1849]|nr:oxidoreductase [Xylariales sp. AK1849]
MAQHRAAFLDKAGETLRVGARDTPKPGPTEVLIKNAAVAINPVDWKIQDSGVLVKQWPAVIGSDLAGIVIEVGEDVSIVRKGQRVIANSQLFGSNNLDQAGYQELVISPETSVSPLPDSISYEAGVVLPLSISTAAAGLFQSDHLALEKPSTNPKRNGNTLLVWGGSSSVGASTIQLAVASGYDVVSTASERNFDLIKQLGATAVFDYNSSAVVTDLVEELRKGKFAGVYDAIGTRESELLAAEVVVKLGSGTIATVLPPPEDLPSNITSKQVFALSIFTQHTEVGEAVWQDFLPLALASGQLKPAPDQEVVGKGLEALQGAFDRQKAGVSGKKIVVTL